MKRNKVLLVEDDLGLSSVLIDFLEENGIEVIHTNDGGEALSLFQKRQPDLAILDIILPNKSGFEITKEIRELDFVMPILLMTGTEVDADSEIKGYDLGAINYMRKPILPQALLAQIRNLLLIPKDIRTFIFNNLRITIQRQDLYINNDAVIKLHDTEAKLILLLLQHESFIVDRDKLFLAIWGHDSISLNNSLDRAVLRLRKKLAHYSGISIETIYGGGYKLKVH